MSESLSGAAEMQPGGGVDATPLGVTPLRLASKRGANMGARTPVTRRNDRASELEMLRRELTGLMGRLDVLVGITQAGSALVPQELRLVQGSPQGLVEPTRSLL